MKKYILWITLCILWNFIIFELLIWNFIYNEKYVEEYNRFSLKPNTNIISLIWEWIFKTRVNNYWSPVYFNENLNKKRILFFWDSFTEWYWVKEKNHFISLLQHDRKFDEYQFINLWRSWNTFLDYILTEGLYYTKTDKKYQHIFILLKYDDFLVKKVKWHHYMEWNEIEYITFLDSKEKKYLLEQIINKSNLLWFMLQKINKLDLKFHIFWTAINTNKKIITKEIDEIKRTDELARINKLFDLFEEKINKDNVTFIIPSWFNTLAEINWNHNYDLDILENIFKERKYSYIDVRKDYINYYKDTYKLAFWFYNSSITNGHLNNNWHEILYNKIKKYITKN